MLTLRITVVFFFFWATVYVSESAGKRTFTLNREAWIEKRIIYSAQELNSSMYKLVFK